MRGSAFLTAAIVAAIGTSDAWAARARPEKVPVSKAFRAELVKPGETQSSELAGILGKPYRRVQETAHHEFYFYDLGEGATMDATVSVRSGVVEYVSYLCSESLSDVRQKFAGETAVNRALTTEGAGLTSTLQQVIYEGKGRGYIYEPKTFKVRACIAWAPGKKFDELSQ
ncbi:MAG: hypothetical protein HY075_10210 [Deltaproteobacteria bacterium]|nr:hypothetical protein [Deltaproteobacteria bacterium]